MKRQVAQAETQEQISANEVSQTKLDLAFDVQNNYLNALRAQQNVTADERVVEQISNLLERARDRAPGVVPFLEVELGNAQQSLTSSRTGQSNPASAFAVMTSVPSGGLPKLSSVEGRSLIPAPAASSDWSISAKCMIPFAATSALRRAIVSCME